MRLPGGRRLFSIESTLSQGEFGPNGYQEDTPYYITGIRPEVTYSSSFMTLKIAKVTQNQRKTQWLTIVDTTLLCESSAEPETPANKDELWRCDLTKTKWRRKRRSTMNPFDEE